MNPMSLIMVVFIGGYSFLRNNIYKFPDQITIILNPNIFYKAFLPCVMVLAATTALFGVKKEISVSLSIFTLAIDSLNRLAVLANFLYQYFIYEPQQINISLNGSVAITNNLTIPTILLVLEVFVILLFFKNFRINNYKVSF